MQLQIKCVKYSSIYNNRQSIIWSYHNILVRKILMAETMTTHVYIHNSHDCFVFQHFFAASWIGDKRGGGVPFPKEQVLDQPSQSHRINYWLMSNKGGMCGGLYLSSLHYWYGQYYCLHEKEWGESLPKLFEYVGDQDFEDYMSSNYNTCKLRSFCMFVID